MKTKLFILSAAVSLATILTRAQIADLSPTNLQYENINLTTNQLDAVLVDMGVTNVNAPSVRMVFIRGSHLGGNTMATVRLTFIK
jgi:hypothetical protein